ncbi:hypothetical protein QMK11_09010 [Campylobacter jejuni]|nr:hypothetical protein QMK15_09195 [Campylobacter jejuni]WHN18267.1 hypothetical protein QMK11_09010 [Campylobacter jejuni]
MNKIGVTHLGDDFLNQTRIELKEKLDLIGCEVSFNKLQANTCVPFLSIIINKTKSFLLF